MGQAPGKTQQEPKLTTPLDTPADLKHATNLLFEAINKTTSKVAVMICR